MAKVLKFTRNAVDLDLNDGDPGFQIQEWNPNMATPLYGRDAPSVEENMRVRAKGSSQDNLAAYLQAFAQQQVWADQYRRDRNTEHPVWLYSQLASETGARQSAVRSIEGSFRTPWYGHRVGDDEVITDIRVVRMPWWERDVARTLPDSLPIKGLMFDSGSTAFTLGETLTGDTTSHTGDVTDFILLGGSWGGGDASGIVYMKDASGVFQDNEPINGSAGGDNMATAHGTVAPRASVPIDYTETADIVGDTGARLPICPFEVTAGANIDRLWVGIRSENGVGGGSVTEFLPVWECEDGTNNASESGVTDDDATDTTNASPGGGKGVFVKLIETDLDWDAGTFLEVMSISLVDVVPAAIFDSNFGTFLWLLRTMVTAGKWEVQLRYGYSLMEDADYVQGRIVEISTTAFDFIETDVMPIPLRDPRTIPYDTITEAYEGGYTIQIWARRTDGSGNLYLDCLCPIPVAEGYLFVRGANVATANVVNFGEGPTGMTNVTTFDVAPDLYVYELPEFEEHNFRLPPGDGRWIIAIARVGASSLADFVEPLATVGYIERWSSFRGAE